MNFPKGFESLPWETPEFHGLVTKIVEVPPDLAAEWLSFNHHHRKVSKKKVKNFKETMTKGDWKINGKTIVFDHNGKLVSGQHRLSSCVESGVPFRTFVVCGVDPSTVEREEPKPKKVKKSAKHDGGPVQATQRYVIDENGKERFVTPEEIAI